MTFSRHLWQKTLPIYESIIDHPFNQELLEGTLSRERFCFYMEQDAYYLVHFSRAFALIAARLDSSKIIHHFLKCALGALVAERELHAKFLPEGKSCDYIEPSPACMAYTRFLLATAATAALEEAVAAVLPCFWIYREVGQSILLRTRENNPYKLWIDTYASQEFADSTERAIGILDKMAEKCSDEVLTRMEKAFEYSSLYEWHFWDDAYHQILFKEAYRLFDKNVTHFG